MGCVPKWLNTHKNVKIPVLESIHVNSQLCLKRILLSTYSSKYNVTCHLKIKCNHNFFLFFLFNMENIDDVYILKRNIYFWTLIVDRVFLQTTHDCPIYFLWKLLWGGKIKFAVLKLLRLSAWTSYCRICYKPCGWGHTHKPLQVNNYILERANNCYLELTDVLALFTAFDFFFVESLLWFIQSHC